nr:serine/threonine protein phosphatase 2A 55 kDa regulatory subunit B beta isoform-like [Tanacetum cinerariifolium]
MSYGFEIYKARVLLSWSAAASVLWEMEYVVPVYFLCSLGAFLHCHIWFVRIHLDIRRVGEMSGGEMEWKFSQVFGERTAGEEVQEVDIISAIEFDKSGDHLATGDRGGRVVLFERTDNKQ